MSKIKHQTSNLLLSLSLKNDLVLRIEIDIFGNTWSLIHFGLFDFAVLGV